MAKATHTLQYFFEAVNVRGERKRFSASKVIDIASWDEPRDAAIFFVMNEDIPSLDGWHLTAPRDIQVWNVVPLSDTGMA
ncbi:hypothetical protein HJB79_32050 [Rhizobium lentis]|uniref:hypothetical protein n=1 Tax=Rhizobium lentis TaxID=1138194 RepID=UPI001C834056|nr:hypothetical protein [Rhizobium lentis]MBX5143332.1 hypothetical protein [Rhizobium lentis]